MDVALVEHAQHDVHSQQGRQNQEGLTGQGAFEFLRRAHEVGAHSSRHADLGLGAVDGVDRIAQRQTGRHVERDRHCRKLPLVSDGQGRAAGLEMGERAQSHLVAGLRAHIDILQCCRVVLKFRLHLQDDPILIELSENDRHLALAKGIVKHVIDRLGQYSKT